MREKIYEEVYDEVAAISEILTIMGNAAISGVQPAAGVSLVYLAGRLDACGGQLQVACGGLISTLPPDRA